RQGGHEWTALDDLPKATDRKVGGWSAHWAAALGFCAGCSREVPVVAGPGDEIAAEAGGRGHLRASHADREQVIGTLKAAFVQGRLVKDELDLRVGQALAPRTYAELAALTADLPAGLHVGKSRPPGPVRNAVRVMCAGAVLTLASVAVVLVTL